MLIKDAPGSTLPSDQTQVLQQTLQDAALACADANEVAVFTLACDASDWLEQFYYERGPDFYAGNKVCIAFLAHMAQCCQLFRAHVNGYSISWILVFPLLSMWHIRE